MQKPICERRLFGRRLVTLDKSSEGKKAKRPFAKIIKRAVLMLDSGYHALLSPFEKWGPCVVRQNDNAPQFVWAKQKRPALTSGVGASC